MERRIITAGFIKTICWEGYKIVDWASGKKYSLDGSEVQFGELHAFSFDSAIGSANGEYAFIYKNLAQKGFCSKMEHYLGKLIVLIIVLMFMNTPLQ